MKKSEELVVTPQSLILNRKQLRKMNFIMNCLDRGWTVKKQTDTFIFSKKHENKREVFQEDYLETFLVTNLEGQPLNKL